MHDAHLCVCATHVDCQQLNVFESCSLVVVIVVNLVHVIDILMIFKHFETGPSHITQSPVTRTCVFQHFRI